MALLVDLCRSAVVRTVAVAAVMCLGPGIADASAAAGSTIGSAPAINLGETVSGGGHHIDLYKVSLTGGEKVTVAVSVANTYHFALFSPETTDGSLSTSRPLVEQVTTSGLSGVQDLTLQAPYTATYVFAVCEGRIGCPDSTGLDTSTIEPYSFSLTAQAPTISSAVAALETRAGSTIASAAPLRLNSLESGGGQHLDFWTVRLEASETLGISVVAPGQAGVDDPYAFALFPGNTNDGSFGQTKPVSQVLTTSNVTAPQHITLKVPGTGTYIFAVCEGQDGCPADGGEVGRNPMDPYTFTATPHRSAAAERKIKLAAALRKCVKVRRSKRAACIRAAKRRYG